MNVYSHTLNPDLKQFGDSGEFLHKSIHLGESGRSGNLGVLGDLGEFGSRSPDLVVEMAHPAVTREWGKVLLEKTNYMLISVTALADPEIEKMIGQRYGDLIVLPMLTYDNDVR